MRKLPPYLALLVVFALVSPSVALSPPSHTLSFVTPIYTGALIKLSEPLPSSPEELQYTFSHAFIESQHHDAQLVIIESPHLFSSSEPRPEGLPCEESVFGTMEQNAYHILSTMARDMHLVVITEFVVFGTHGEVLAVLEPKDSVATFDAFGEHLGLFCAEEHSAPRRGAIRRLTDQLASQGVAQLLSACPLTCARTGIRRVRIPIYAPGTPLLLRLTANLVDPSPLANNVTHNVTQIPTPIPTGPRPAPAFQWWLLLIGFGAGLLAALIAVVTLCWCSCIRCAVKRKKDYQPMWGTQPLNL
eukprot:gnl/Trimastix_PCT/4406.p1 GENE.gnl/Trimastix_PCT/4406~~gnl/Trimastix_PCT/4406.p1  ORF type:complete len:302 (+),score=25.38 gnl/Trimastix_PCT/4406:27-932(+)